MQLRLEVRDELSAERFPPVEAVDDEVIVEFGSSRDLDLSTRLEPAPALFAELPMRACVDATLKHACRHVQRQTLLPGGRTFPHTNSWLGCR